MESKVASRLLRLYRLTQQKRLISSNSKENVSMGFLHENKISQPSTARVPEIDTSHKSKPSNVRYNVGTHYLPGNRNYRSPVFPHLKKGKPYKPLTVPLKRTGGRNNTGRIVTRHRGGGAKRRVRLIDFKRLSPGLFEVVSIEYDPNRSAHIALVKSLETGEFAYHIAMMDMAAGDVVQSYRSGIPDHMLNDAQKDASLVSALIVKRGNCVPLKYIPSGNRICLIGTDEKSNAKFCRSAGTFAVIIKKGVTHVTLQLSSGEVRKVSVDGFATIGTVSNPEWNQKILGKAGRYRWKGWRPSVNGTSMNACDHPHGGGRGHAKGYKRPVSKWGLPKFRKTRIGKGSRNPMLVKKRPSKRLLGR